MIRKVPSYPFSSDEWITAWHETIGKNWELVGDNLARRGNELILAGGYEVADYLDIPDPTAWDEIRKKYPGYHLALRNVPEDSPTVTYFHMEKEDTTPIMTLPDSWKTYLETLDKKSRHEMERKIRKFEREHQNIEIHDSTDPVADTELLLSLMKLDERKKRFLTLDMEEFLKKIIAAFQKNIVLTILTISGQLAAAMLAFHDGDTLMGYNSGFNEERFSGAGFYLKTLHIKRAISSGIKTYNFLQGNERYKYELGGKDFFVYKGDILL